MEPPAHRVVSVSVAKHESHVHRSWASRHRFAESHRARVGYFQSIKGERVVDRVKSSQAKVVHHNFCLHSGDKLTRERSSSVSVGALSPETKETVEHTVTPSKKGFFAEETNRKCNMLESINLQISVKATEEEGLNVYFPFS